MKSLLIGLCVFTASCVGATDKDIVFTKGTLTINGKTVKIEVADTDPLRERGLMYRKELGEDAGMLFVFQSSERRNFWMKNTFVPLSIGYFDSSKKLIEVFDMTPVTSEMQVDVPQYPSSKPAMYALEMPKGWFAKNNVKPGAVFTYKKD
jgi:uncharacterized membrane protein (UPF0127 family)